MQTNPVVDQSMASETPAPAGLTVSAVRQAVRGAVPTAKVSALYRLGLVVSAVVMVLLPLLYVGITVAAAGAVLWWARVGLAVFNARINILTLLIYLGPLFAGCTVVFFMFKPLFARPQKVVHPLDIDLANEPALAAFIEEICRAVGAPRPRRVRVDCQVNASASFRRGWWSLFSRDLVLTIGLPLGAGLTARQLAGVLAHEFGHFAQGAGMRATFVIRAVNAWFARVVFARDEWDASLERSATQGDWRIMLVASVARGAVWLARQVLHGLMLAGHAISSFQLRQMEFDADHYEIQLAGSASHTATSAEIRLLGTAGAQAQEDLETMWRDRRLVDDLPALILTRRRALTAKTVAEVAEAAAKAVTRWHDTHPSDAARDAAAVRAAAPGRFALEAGAAELFADFPALCRAATRHYYEKQIGVTLTDGMLESAANVSAQVNERKAVQEEFEQFTGSAIDLARPLVAARRLLECAGQPADWREARDAAARKLAAAGPNAKTAGEKWNEAAKEEFDLYAAAQFVANGITIRPASFGLVSARPEWISDRQREKLAQLVATLPPLAEIDGALLDWLAASAALARCAAPDDPQAAGMNRLAPIFSALDPGAQAFGTVLRHFRHAMLLHSNGESLRHETKFRILLGEVQGRLITSHKALLAAVQAVPNPLPGRAVVTSQSVADVIRAATPAEGAPCEYQAQAALGTFAEIYFSTLARLVWLGRRLGPPAIAPAA